MNELSAVITALMRQHHAVGVGNLAADDRNETCVLWVHLLDELLSGWRIRRILTEHRAMDVVAQSDAHQSGDMRGNSSDVGFLRTDSKSQMAKLVGDSKAGKNSERGGGRYEPG